MPLHFNDDQTGIYSITQSYQMTMLNRAIKPIHFQVNHLPTRADTAFFCIHSENHDTATTDIVGKNICIIDTAFLRLNVNSAFNIL